MVLGSLERGQEPNTNRATAQLTLLGCMFLLCLLCGSAPSSPSSPPFVLGMWGALGRHTKLDKPGLPLVGKNVLEKSPHVDQAPWVPGRSCAQVSGAKSGSLPGGTEKGQLPQQHD